MSVVKYKNNGNLCILQSVPSYCNTIMSFFSTAEIPPTALNVNVTCSSVLSTTTRSYDISVVFFIDATFTLSRVSAIDSIRTTIVEVDGSGNAVLPNFRRESVPFQGIERGPGNVTLIFPNNRPLADRQGFYSVQVKKGSG